MSYYDELGVTPDATNEEIRAAFRRKAKRHHPDRGGSADKMAAANRAYETLISPERRLTYDRTGEDRAPPVDHLAQQLVTATVLEWFDAEPNSGDLIKDVGERFTAEQRQLLQQIVNGKAMLNRLQKRLKKLKYRGKGVDLVRAAVAQKIRDVRQQLERINDRTKLLDRAKELLRDYEYEVDAPAEPPQFDPGALKWIFHNP